MSQSLTQIYVHIIFRIKHEQTGIRQTDIPKLNAYMSGIVKHLESISLSINGMPDHLHVFCILSKNMALSTFVQRLKQNSSKWIKSIDPYYRNFEWQRGYGAFSVSSSLIVKTDEYIRNQQKHHQKRSFREEYLLFLKEYGIEYDEDHLWR